MPRSGAVERGSVHGRRRGPRTSGAIGHPRVGGAEVATGDPEAFRHQLRRGRHLVDGQRRIADLVEAHAEEPRGGVPEVGVRVDESRKHEAIAQLDDLRCRSPESEHLLLGPDRDETVAADRDRSRLGPLWIDGPDPSSVKDQIGRLAHNRVP